MTNQKTTQKDNVVHGHQAGRDVNIKQYACDPSRPTEMSRLIEKFKKEHKGDVQFQETIEKLEHYMARVSDEDVVGLEAKLAAGGYSDLLVFAQNTKELFTKKLAQHPFSESAQRMHAYLLAEVYSRYHLHVYPQIQQGEQKEKIRELIQSHVVEPIQDLLEDNVLELYADEINGMLYFLTGNCHTKWV